MSILPKKYGLILKKPAEVQASKPVVRPVAGVFADDDENEAAGTSSDRVSASTIRMQMQAKREYEKALAEDPTAFEYDAIYDELQAKKNEKIAEVKAADKERKSKYAEQILEAHKKRLLAQQSREERKQQKEREAEAGQFDDKEKFVTNAYRQQLAEMEKFRLQEAADKRLDDLTAVEKQKSGMWKGGFYRTLLNDIARDGDSTAKTDEGIKKEVVESVIPQELLVVDPKEHAKKLSALRKNTDNDETLPQGLSSKTRLSKSIYSDESDEEPESSSATSQPTVVQLKPGLNILKPQVKKRPTKAEQIRQRFTPSPEHSATSSSSDTESEEASKERRKRLERRHQSRERKSHDRQKGNRRNPSPRNERTSRRRHGDRRRSRERRVPEKEKEMKEHKKSDSSKLKTKGPGVGKQEKLQKEEEKTKEERLRTIKKILAHRNGPEEIEQMRQRYLERKRNGAVPLPL